VSEVAPEVVLRGIFGCRLEVRPTGFFVHLYWWFLVVLMGGGGVFLELLIWLLMYLFLIFLMQGRFLFVYLLLNSLEEGGLFGVRLSLWQ
jgi:hypothetical protein